MQSIDEELLNREYGKCWIPNPTLLEERGIQFHIIEQEPGDIVVGKSGVYHGVWSKVMLFNIVLNNVFIDIQSNTYKLELSPI